MCRTVTAWAMVVEVSEKKESKKQKLKSAEDGKETGEAKKKLPKRKRRWSAVSKESVSRMTVSQDSTKRRRRRRTMESEGGKRDEAVKGRMKEGTEREDGSDEATS